MATSISPVFWVWAGWRDKGGIPSQRPAAVTAYIKTHGSIPVTWWARYAIHKGKVKLPNNLPGSIPVGPSIRPPFSEVIIFTDADPALVLSKCPQVGNRLSIAITSNCQPSVADAIRFKQHGVYFWQDYAANTAALAYLVGTKDVILQTEGPGQKAAAFAVTTPVGGSKAIIGNGDMVFTPLNGFSRIFELYWNTGVNPVTLDSHGYPVDSWCYGCYDPSSWEGGQRRYLDEYLHFTNLRPFSIFSGEAMTDRDWEVLNDYFKGVYG